MAFKLADRVQETTATVGTGNLTLAGATPNYRTFGSVLSNGDTTRYAIVDDAAGAWEIGVGTWGTGNLLQRAVVASSNANALVSLAGNAATKVFITADAGYLGSLDPPYSRPPLSAFTWFSQDASATAVDMAGGPLVISIPPPTATTALSALTLLAPTAPYTVTALIDTAFPETNGNIGGLFLGNATSKGGVRFGHNVDTSLSVPNTGLLGAYAFSNLTAYVATPVSAKVLQLGRLFYRALNDATNITLLYSISGAAGSFVSSAQFTVAAGQSPDSIGFFGIAGATPTGLSGITHATELRHWQVISGASPQAACDVTL